MAAESCYPRGLSWLPRSCVPADPTRHIAVPLPISAASTTNPASDTDEESPISALPDELLLECLTRVPRASLLPLPAVCRRFAALLASEGFLHLRRAHGLLRPCLLAVNVSAFARALLHLGGASSRPDIEVAALPLPPQLLHCAGGSSSSSSAFAHARAVALGPREVYLIGRGATLRVDALTGAARACAPTLFPRKKFAAAAVGARIYVAGGSARTGAVEEYDPAVDAWRVVAEVPRRRYGCAGAGAGGVFYVCGGVAVSGGRRGGEESPPRAALEAHACAGSVDALHVASGAWAWSARPRAVPAGGCVVGACGGGDGHLYVVASHAVELSFWRWSGGGGANRGGGGGGACGWVALEAPPVPRGSVGLGMAVRVAMAGVGGDKVAAVVNVAAVRGHNAAGNSMEGLVLVYDIAGGKWSRTTDLPPGFRRAACAAVEC
ncbi:hypothetical protein HU200_054359 [Digitaria exilis]|uniref:F-box domain-containing protein n=1 Tax=Digitaria exilis TaxID=1010633 RepID=A0A835AV28_9POAL|nr:hypothetical protein HU200_054359 [Digitaria exilis]CAB3490854.1 unnamed protein product [Digitaria exilis]